MLLGSLFSLCPPGFAYFNNSCFAIYKQAPVGASGSPGKYVDDSCKAKNYSARGASIHSIDEQWFLFHYYMTLFGYMNGLYFYLGAYKNDTGKNFTYRWYDGSPTDFIPKWGYAYFWSAENNDNNAAGISLLL